MDSNFSKIDLDKNLMFSVMTNGLPQVGCDVSACKHILLTSSIT